LNWKNNLWKLKLIDYNPDPYEMLEFQSKGIRTLSILWNESLEGNLVENKRDALEHLLHDILHAYCFFKEEKDFILQKNIFRNIQKNIEKFTTYLENEEFKKNFYYILSDMNSNSAHLLEFLKAIIIQNLKKSMSLKTNELLPESKILEINELIYSLKEN
jgi:hypothetical protein